MEICVEGVSRDLGGRVHSEREAPAHSTRAEPLAPAGRGGACSSSSAFHTQLPGKVRIELLFSVHDPSSVAACSPL